MTCGRQRHNLLNCFEDQEVWMLEAVFFRMIWRITSFMTLFLIALKLSM